MGKLKKRIHPSDITINIGKDAPIPECPINGEGFLLFLFCLSSLLENNSLSSRWNPYVKINSTSRSWKEIRHDNTVTWLAYWIDPITSKEFKYVFLAASSSLKGFNGDI